MRQAFQKFVREKMHESRELKDREELNIKKITLDRDRIIEGLLKVQDLKTLDHIQSSIE